MTKEQYFWKQLHAYLVKGLNKDKTAELMTMLEQREKQRKKKK